MYLLLLIFCVMVQFYLSKRLKKLQRISDIETNIGMTGKEIAQFILFQRKEKNVSIKQSENGQNYYNPRTNEVVLAKDVYNETSLADMVIAAHEVAHSFQDRFLDKLNVWLIPFKIIQILSIVGFVVGGFLSIFFDFGNFPQWCINIYAIILFVESLLKICIEADAWKRTYHVLNKHGLKKNGRLYKQAKKISNTAFGTYVCQTLICGIIMLMIL